MTHVVASSTTMHRMQGIGTKKKMVPTVARVHVGINRGSDVHYLDG